MPAAKNNTAHTTLIPTPMKNNEEYLDMNNQSAVTRVTYGSRTILFMADMEQPGQVAMFNRIDPELHKRLAFIAFAHKVSLNTSVEEAISEYVVKESSLLDEYGK